MIYISHRGNLNGKSDRENQPDYLEEALAQGFDVEIDVLETKPHHTPAYPSGHAAYGYLIAELLSDKYPQHKKELMKLGDKTGFLRVVQGVHYPSDSLSANQLVRTLYNNIKSNREKKS